MTQIVTNSHSVWCGTNIDLGSDPYLEPDPDIDSEQKILLAEKVDLSPSKVFVSTPVTTRRSHQLTSFSPSQRPFQLTGLMLTFPLSVHEVKIIVVFFKFKVILHF